MSHIGIIRGDNKQITFSLPADNWEAGGTLFYAVKTVIDDVVTDTTAVLKKDFDDTVVTDVTIDGVDYKKYTLDFSPTETFSIVSNGKKTLSALSEFQWVNSDKSIVRTFPSSNNKIKTIIYMDVNRRTE